MADPTIKDIAYRALAATLGGPVDFASMVMRPFGYKTPSEQVVGGSEWISKNLQNFGLENTAQQPTQNFVSSVMPVRSQAEMKPTPQDARLSSLADLLAKGREVANQYEVQQWVPLLGGTGVGDLLIGKAPEEVTEWSYGNAPMRINPYAGQTASFVPEVKPGRQESFADAVMLGADVLPVGFAAKKLTGFTDNLPVGASIKDVSGDAFDNVAQDSFKMIQERVPGVKPGEELIVQHNLTASKLTKADKLGGLPVPSLAVSRASNPLENFGEITLIAPKEFAKPSAKNPVFRADAYTARFPSIDFQIDTKSANNLQSFFSDVINTIPDGKRSFNNILDDWKNREYSDVMRAKFLSERGELPDPKQFENSFLFKQEIGKRIDKLQTEFSDWTANLDDRLKDAGVKIKERIFKGFTYSGNRRYADATLDNIVKEMKGGAGEEGFNYGVGNLRAVATPRFRTLDQVKASRGKLIDNTKMSEIKQQTDDAYFDILSRMRKLNERYNAEDALLEFAESKRMSTLDRIYDGKMPDDLKADIGIFLQKIQELPTEYFELKPQRAVTIDEFRGAIIPKDTPKAARDVLNKAGITEVYEYSTPEERRALFQKYGKEMFVAAPALPIGAASMTGSEEQ